MSWVGLLPALLSIAVLLSGKAVAAQDFHGRVMDEQTGDPIAGAVVTLTDNRERSVRSVVTDAAGAFVLRASGAGLYRLHAAAMGYVRTVSQPVDVLDNELVRVELRLSVDPVPLPPVMVITGRGEMMHPHLARWGYYERRTMWEPLGAHFLDQGELRRRHPLDLTGVLRTIPDLRVHNLGGRGRGGGVVVTNRNGRELSVCLDGMYMRPVVFREFTLDELVPMSQVLSMEIYASTSSSGNARCDIMIWTGIADDESR